MISKLTKDFLNKCITEIKKDENQKNINTNIINPFIKTMSARIFPYVTFLFIMYSVTLILLIVILTLIIYKIKK